MAVFEEATLVAVFGSLLDSIIRAKKRAVFFKRTLQHLECTIKNVKPIIHRVLSLENIDTETCDRFLQLLEKTERLVDMYSDISKWKLLKKRKVKKLIQEMDASLQRFMKYDIQAEQLLYLATTDAQITELNKKMDQMIALFQGNDGTNMEESKPVDAKEESSTKQETAENKDEQSKFSFEFRLKMSKGKCLDIKFHRYRD